MAPDSTQRAEDMVPDPITPEPVDVPDTWLEDVTRPARQYLLKHLTEDKSPIRVIQYVEDAEVNDTIQRFLGFCRDTGWQIEEERV